MANIIQGSDLMLFMNGHSIACATNCTLSINAETTDTSHKDIKGTWKSSSIKSLSWEATTENLFTFDGAGSTYEDLVNAMINKTAVTLFIAQPAGELGNDGYSAKMSWYFAGFAKISSITLNMLNGENATYTAQFIGVGELQFINGQLPSK